MTIPSTASLLVSCLTNVADLIEELLDVLGGSLSDVELSDDASTPPLEDD